MFQMSLIPKNKKARCELQQAFLFKKTAYNDSTHSRIKNKRHQPYTLKNTIMKIKLNALICCKGKRIFLNCKEKG